MGTAERRNEILKILCRRRCEKIHILAEEFAVSTRTIQRDIDVLSRTNPIYTKAGKYGGGVYVIDDYHINRIYMSTKELNVLKKTLSLAEKNRLLTSDEIKTLNNMIIQYSKPEKNNTKKLYL